MFYKTDIVGDVIHLFATAIALVKIIERKENYKYDIMVAFVFCKFLHCFFRRFGQC